MVKKTIEKDFCDTEGCEAEATETCRCGAAMCGKHQYDVQFHAFDINMDGQAVRGQVVLCPACNDTLVEAVADKTPMAAHLAAVATKEAEDMLKHT